MARSYVFLYAAVLIAGIAAADDRFVDYVVENASAIPEPLTDWSGDADIGASLFAATGCTNCHKAPGYDDAPNIGPDLTGIASRLSTGEIRLMIVEPSIRYAQTDMPAYYSIGIKGSVPDELVGRTRLSADEVEQLVAWLSTLSN